MRYFLLITMLLPLINSVQGATVNVSGGGLNLETAWDACVPDTTIVITDSQTYNQSHAWTASLANHDGLVLKAATGQTPTILLDHAAASVSIALGDGVSIQVGANDGGRITIDSGDNVGAYLYSNGDPKDLTVENVDFHSSGNIVDSHIIFYGVSAGTHTLTVDNCRFENTKVTDGCLQVWEGASQPAVHVANITNCTWDNCKRAIFLRGGDDHAGVTARSRFTLSHCQILNTQPNQPWADFYGTMFDVFIDHLLVNNLAGAKSACTFGDANFSTNRAVTATIDHSAVVDSWISVILNCNITLNHCDCWSSNHAPFSLGSSFTGIANVTNSNFINDDGTKKSLEDTSSGSPTVTSDYNNCPQAYSGHWAAGAHDKAVAPLYVSFPDNLTVQAPQLVGTASDGENIGSKEPGPPITRAAHWELLK